MFRLCLKYSVYALRNNGLHYFISVVVKFHYFTFREYIHFFGSGVIVTMK